jgi:hypothetical protein
MRKNITNRKVLLMLLPLLTLEGLAQVATRDSSERVLTVLDAETRMAVRDVLVYLPSGEHVRTNWEGCFVIHSAKWDRLKLRHANYYDRYVYPPDLNEGDTLLLLPRVNRLGEVVVYGHRKDLQTQADALSQEIGAYAARNATRPSGITGDFAGALDFKGRARKKRLERTKKILEKY